MARVEPGRLGESNFPLNPHKNEAERQTWYEDKNTQIWTPPFTAYPTPLEEPGDMGWD